MALAAPTHLRAQLLEPLATLEQVVARRVPASTLVTVRQDIGVLSAHALVTLTQTLSRNNPGGALVTLEQGVYSYTNVPATTLATLDQAVRRRHSVTTLVTLGQAIHRRHPAATLATLRQAVGRRVSAGVLAALDQYVEHPLVHDWEVQAPVERQTIYVLDVGDLRVPISSVQATMRADGQSFLQAVIPAGSEWVDALEAVRGQTMRLRKGYRYANGDLSPLEAIAEAPFEQLRSDEGATNSSVTISGYGTYQQTTHSRRALRQVRYRSLNDGARRVRADVDLFLRPGHTAIDSDGTEFEVATIQYFIGRNVENMEVLQ